MILTYLGTAAAEGLPAVWCNCPACKRAKTLGGREIRTRNQILVDKRILIDFPMDTYMHALTHRLDLSEVDTVLISHAHMDHCYPQEFILHGAPFAHDMTEPIVTIYGNATVGESFREATRAELRADIAPSIPFHTLKPYQRFSTPAGYEITSLPARHTVGEECLLYAVRKDGKTALFFNDSGILPDEVYTHMEKLGLRFDLVSFDCTYGHARHGEGRHMGALDAMDEREKLRAHHLVHDGTRYVLTHFSHNCEQSHAELEAQEAQYGFTVAYDGLRVEI